MDSVRCPKISMIVIFRFLHKLRTPEITAHNIHAQLKKYNLTGFIRNLWKIIRALKYNFPAVQQLSQLMLENHRSV